MPDENFSTVREILSWRCLTICGADLMLDLPRWPTGWTNLKITSTSDEPATTKMQ
jgi:hypothetical protein